MASEETSKEKQIISMMKRVLTEIAKDTYTAPGQPHPLSDSTIFAIRDCLAAITTRERELADASGETMDLRPRFADERAKTATVSVSQIGGKKKPNGDGETH